MTSHWRDGRITSDAASERLLREEERQTRDRARILLLVKRAQGMVAAAELHQQAINLLTEQATMIMDDVRATLLEAKERDAVLREALREAQES